MNGFRDTRGDVLQRVLIWVLLAVVIIPVLVAIGGGIVDHLRGLYGAASGGGE